MGGYFLLRGAELFGRDRRVPAAKGKKLRLSRGLPEKFFSKRVRKSLAGLVTKKGERRSSFSPGKTLTQIKGKSRRRGGGKKRIWDPKKAQRTRHLEKGVVQDGAYTDPKKRRDRFIRGGVL